MLRSKVVREDIQSCITVSYPPKVIKRLRDVSTTVRVWYLLLGGFPVEGIFDISIPCTRHRIKINNIYMTQLIEK